MQAAAKRLRSVPLGAEPSIFVGLDDDAVVVGFDGTSPLQVWDLATGKLVRQFDGKGEWCCSLINLPGGRIAAGWRSGTNYVVAIFDSITGKLLQELTRFRGPIYGLALVEDHLLTMCNDKTLGVWSHDSERKVRRLPVRPRGKREGSIVR